MVELGQVNLVVGQNGLGKKWAILKGLKIGWVNQVVSELGQVRPTCIFHIKKKL